MRCFCGATMNGKVINDRLFYRCPECGYLMKLNKPNSVEEKERYDLHICDEGYLKYMNNVANSIKPYVNGRTLDYGCGQVHALANILECEYYDLYYFNEMPKGKFDTIVLIEVFEHIENPLKLLKSLDEVLNDGGSIVIMTQIIKEPLEKWWYLRDITHISFVTEASMIKLAELCNFSYQYDEKSSVFVLKKA